MIIPFVHMEPTTLGHLRALQKTMRAQDRRELERLGFGTPGQALWRSYKKGVMNTTAIIEGDVAAVWGCAGEIFGPTGQPWLLTSDVVNKITPLYFTRLYRKEVFKMLEIFPALVNVVDASYDKAVRLLEIVGFKLGEPEPIGTGMFRVFSMGRG